MTTEATLTIFAGVFCKLWHIPAAQTMLQQHTHDYDHLTILTAGRIRVFYGGVSDAVHEAPALIKVTANTPHSFLSLTDGVTLACVHAVGLADKES